jgi:hypothetical protein
MNILGINAYHGNASAAIVCDGKLVAAVEEERFNRVKYAAGFPTAAIRYCLKEARLTLAEIDHVAVPRNPYARLGTKLFYAVRMPSFARERIKVMSKFTGIPEALAQAFDTDAAKLKATFHRVEHHQAHLASTYFVSPFEHAALLSADGLGDFASSMWGVGEGNRCIWRRCAMYCASAATETSSDSSWASSISRITKPDRKCRGRNRTKRRCWGRCSPMRCRRNLAYRRGSQTIPWNSGTAILLLHFRRAWKKFIWEC